MKCFVTLAPVKMPDSERLSERMSVATNDAVKPLISKRDLNERISERM